MRTNPSSTVFRECEVNKLTAYKDVMNSAFDLQWQITYFMRGGDGFAAQPVARQLSLLLALLTLLSCGPGKLG